MSLFSFLFFVLSVVGERQQTRTRERELRERELRKTFRQPFWTLDIGEKNSKKKKGKKERERTCGARWLSCAFFENDVDTKKKKKTPYAVPRCLTFNRITTHTHTHNTHAQCSLYNPKSPAPRSSPKLSPRSNNDPPSFRRRLPTAKVRFRKTEETTNHREPQKHSRKRWITKE